MQIGRWTSGLVSLRHLLVSYLRRVFLCVPRRNAPRQWSPSSIIPGLRISCRNISPVVVPCLWCASCGLNDVRHLFMAHVVYTNKTRRLEIELSDATGLCPFGFPEGYPTNLPRFVQRHSHRVFRKLCRPGKCEIIKVHETCSRVPIACNLHGNDGRVEIKLFMKLCKELSVPSEICIYRSQCQSLCYCSSRVTEP